MTNNVTDTNVEKNSFERYVLYACSFIGHEIDAYGKVEAITIYGEHHYVDRISFCFKDGDEWSETSARECINFDGGAE